MHPMPQKKKSITQLFLSLSFITLLLASCSSGQVADKSATDKKADLYYANGTANLMNRNYTEALEKLLEANRLRPNDTKVLNNLGMAYYFKNDTKNALRFISESIKVDPKNSDARVNLASIYFQLGNIKEAQEQYLRVTKDLIYPNQFRTYYNLGLISIKENNLAEAKNYFLKSIKEKDDYCPANYQLALIERGNYNFASALEWFRKAQLGTCVSKPEPHMGEAKTLIELREYDKARAKLAYIVEKFPTSGYAAQANGELQELDKKDSPQSGELSLKEKLELQRRLDAIKAENAKPTFESPSF